MHAPWNAVIRLIEETGGQSVTNCRPGAVHGGDINRAWRLSNAKSDYFVKTNRAELIAMFEAEQAGLEEIKHSDSIRVPQVIGCGVEDGQSFIVMEYLEVSGPVDETLLGRQLASMHRRTNDRFGFAIDNTIGSTPQINTFSNHWISFWQNCRLGFQLELAARNRFDKVTISRGERLNAELNAFFVDYQPVASLLHGDLWSGNQGADSNGNPVIFDPACYYGDHEADLAMMELFGRPGDRFFDSYRERFPIDAGYAVRKALYNLYHILNHANLFGEGYMASAARMIDRLLSEVR